MESWLAAMAGQAPAAQPALFAAQLRLQKGLCFVTFWPAQHTLAKNALPKALLKPVGQLGLVPGTVLSGSRTCRTRAQNPAQSSSKLGQCGG